ncbi:MAG: hypothetical protein RJB13_1972 [Pseudomonadota bacterium]
MTSAIYAGSFDPWSIGHEAVLKAAMDVFNEIHILVAVNPSKAGLLEPIVRARIIASALDPSSDWWCVNPPFHVKSNIIISTTPGLVVEYAGRHGIRNLVRGLRSTTDFESEFNLYFSNKTIDPKIQTWAVLCPPELLHCSSTYVRSVVGNPLAKKVGTTFVAQCAMLQQPISLGRLLDFITWASTFRFEVEQADLNLNDLRASIQGLFTTLIGSKDKIDKWIANEDTLGLNDFLNRSQPEVESSLKLQEYPKETIDKAWALLAGGMSNKNRNLNIRDADLTLLTTLGGTLGKQRVRLIDVRFAE